MKFHNTLTGKIEEFTMPKRKFRFNPFEFLRERRLTKQANGWIKEMYKRSGDKNPFTK